MICPNCGVGLNSIQRLLTHLLSQHNGEDTAITCNIEGCRRTFHNANSWKTHIYRTVSHRVALGVVRPLRLAQDVEDVWENHRLPELDANIECNRNAEPVILAPAEKYQQLHSILHKNILSFTLKIREEFMLPQSTVNAIMGDFQGLFESFMLGFSDIIKDQLQIDASPESFNFALSDDHFFSTICDSSKTEKALSSVLSKYFPHTPPNEILLGYTNRKRNLIHIVPLKAMLQTILSNDDIVGEILAYSAQRRNYTGSDFLYDIKFENDLDHAIDLPLIFYIDEFEPCNPIGSRKKTHKLSGIYYSIAALPPRVRSKLKSIFLYGLAHHSYVTTYGYEPILRNALDDLQSMFHEPFEVSTKGGKKLHYRVYLKMLAADNLSAHDIMGFQKSFRSGKVSRHCLVDYTELRTSFDCVLCPLRSEEQYMKDLAVLNQNDNVTNSNGITGNCVFSEIPYVKITQLFPPDLMHDFHEGVVPTIICISILNLIAKSTLRLDAINDAVQQFSYGKCDVKNRYGPILVLKSLKNHSIPGTASEKLCLLRMLPIILAQRFADINLNAILGFRLLLKCLEISDIVLAPVIKREWLAYLHSVIVEHHELVKKIDPTALRPKFHFLAHYPQLINMFGPPRHYYTMRFESVHQYFKRLTKRTGNFINLTQTLSNRYQNLKALQLSKSRYFIEDSIQNGNTETFSFLSHETAALLLMHTTEILPEEHIYVATSIELNGTIYTVGNIYISALSNIALDIPHFFELERIINLRSKWFLIGQLHHTVGFVNRVHAYEISNPKTLTLIEPGDELDFAGLSIYEVNEHKYIPLKYRITNHVSVLTSII